MTISKGQGGKFEPLEKTLDFYVYGIKSHIEDLLDACGENKNYKKNKAFFIRRREFKVKENNFIINFQTIKNIKRTNDSE